MGGLILLVGQAGSPTGFARIIESLAEHLPQAWDVHVLGTDARVPGRLSGARLHANPDATDARALGALRELLARLQPRLVCVVDDPRGAAQYHEVLRERGTARAVLYAPVDRLAGLSSERLAGLAAFDSVVTCTQHGERVLSAAWRRFARGTRQPPRSVIACGVDRRVFRPLAGDPTRGLLTPARRTARARLLPERPDLRDAFIVLNANRNQPGKRIDLTLQGFALFARDKPDNVKLYLHMGTRPRATGETAEVDRLGLRERVLGVTTGAHPAVTTEELNLIYNACDVGLNTSEGEGFGLVALEHAACGAAQVVPGHSACRELWSDAALLLAPLRRTQLAGFTLAGRTVSASDVAHALERLWRDRGLLGDLSAAAYRLALRPEFQWDGVAARFAAHFEALLADR